MVLVCTDAAARGLDIPDVSHVVQAEFAASAVDFIHRVSTLPYDLTFQAFKLTDATNLIFMQESKLIMKTQNSAGLLWKKLAFT